MANQIETWISEQRSQGHPDDAIKKRLEEKGWQQDQISQMMTAASQTTNSESSKPAKDFFSGNKFIIIIAIAVGAILVIGAGVYAYIYFMQ